MEHRGGVWNNTSYTWKQQATSVNVNMNISQLYFIVKNKSYNRIRRITITLNFRQIKTSKFMQWQLMMDEAA